MKREHLGEMKQRKRNICLTVAYDGTNYHGFQRQKPPVVAVQNVLEAALKKICGDEIELAAAGRTDAGVHALGQVVNFFTDGSIPIERLARAANGLLPADIVVLCAKEADRNFSARHSAKRKTYIYRLHSSPVPDPFRRNYAWHIGSRLDLAAMEDAAHFILGAHDFTSFCAAGGAKMSPVRTIYEAEFMQQRDEIVFRLYADGFLYHMARNIMGTLADVGKKRITPQKFKRILEARDRNLASPTAPAQGLYLHSVEY